MVHQHFHLAPRLSVLTICWSGCPQRRPARQGRGLAGLKRIEQQFGWRSIRTAGRGSVGREQQRLEIIKGACFAACAS